MNVLRIINEPLVLPTSANKRTLTLEYVATYVYGLADVLHQHLARPTAAAIAYGLDKKGSGERNVLIYDPRLHDIARGHAIGAR